ncbi:MAG: NUDIX hydrolase [Candidatus Latescibacteria bacterium]|nr:NUDIX hydrolase [Candidatus Latescibacterota bacterium]MBT4138892.1 NUDIX hydrolase [Candidatus Latescibacterota bacterium]MBT5830820.1 NUDIX hydrolase [Candidatus Latescibacterota bacterium]
MHRHSILQQLESYLNQYPNESAMVARYISFVKTNEDCFERSLQIGHVTGSAWVVSREGTHTLLTHHKKLNKWLQLGGHADGDADVLRVSKREVAEESGIVDVVPVGDGIFDVDIHLIPERKDEPEHYHYDVRYAFQVTGDEDYVVSDESHDLAWIEMGQLHKKTQEESMLRMARKWQSKK